jgi:hypothetical protein
MTASAFQRVWGPCVLNKCHANTATYAFDGVSPFFLAFFLALRLLSCIIDSGTRAAPRRQGRRSLAPRKSGGSMQWLDPVVRQEARARGGKHSASMGKSVV